jgi:hypothetical protein
MNVRDHELRELCRIPNVGPAIADLLLRLDVRSPADLRGRDPDALYADLCAADNKRYDICVRDVFAAAISFADGAAARPWWEFSRERKAASG